MSAGPGGDGCRGRGISATDGVRCGCVIAKSGARVVRSVKQRTRLRALLGRVSGETLSVSVLCSRVVNALVDVGWRVVRNSNSGCGELRSGSARGLAGPVWFADHLPGRIPTELWPSEHDAAAFPPVCMTS
jgi:hypothetical protein